MNEFTTADGEIRVTRTDLGGVNVHYLASDGSEERHRHVPGLAANAIREFFQHEALIASKPWLEAQHDEVWVLTTPATGERPYQVVRTEDAGFRFFLISDHEGFRPGLFPEEAQITAGRRIYPEES